MRCWRDRGFRSFGFFLFWSVRRVFLVLTLSAFSVFAMSEVSSYLADSTVLSRRTRVLGVLVNKGGVGKSSAAVSIASVVAASGGKVLIVDLDYQRNATDLLDPVVDRDSLRTVFDAVAAHKSSATSRACFPTAWSALPQISQAGGVIDVLPGDPQFIDRHVDEHGVGALSEALSGVNGMYDLILLDSPPSTGSVVQSALYAADGALLVTEAAHLSLKSLGRTVVFVNEFNANSPKPVEVSGILVSKYNGRLREQREGLASLKARFGEDLLPTRIPFRAAVDSANGRHLPILAWPGPEAAMVTSAYAVTAKAVLSKFGVPEHKPLIDGLDDWIDSGSVAS